MWWPFRSLNARRQHAPDVGPARLPTVRFHEVVEQTTGAGGTIAQRYGLFATFPAGPAAGDAPLLAWLDCATALSQAAPRLAVGERVILVDPQRLGPSPTALSRALQDLVQHGALRGVQPGQIAFCVATPTGGPGTDLDLLAYHGLCLIPLSRFERGELVIAADDTDG
ncbi:MAG: hypothetical protein AAFR93_15010, partial [Pseudomonadota bacterium]